MESKNKLVYDEATGLTYVEDVTCTQANSIEKFYLYAVGKHYPFKIFKFKSKVADPHLTADRFTRIIKEDSMAIDTSNLWDIIYFFQKPLFKVGSSWKFTFYAKHV